ncbi:MAG: cyclic nucleotide-binding domain-containing protein [Anaerolineae bacterium]|nr:cyclic nucleotide-binding domain-containing protein [Anaerolineae bacterium]
MSLLNILRQVDIFYEFPQEHLSKIAEVCHEVTYQKGEIIVQENTPSNELYIIAEGTVEIILDPRLLSAQSSLVEPSTIATLWPGQTFGEIGLVDRGMRSASARSAVDGTLLLAIGRDELLHLCDADHSFGYMLMRNIASDLAFKIRNTDLLLRERLLWEARPR